ncbi:MAG: outer membrane protein insertion porin family [Gammaproteobacteria bacterium]
MKLLVWVSVLSLLLSAFAVRAESFTVDQIEVIGAKKISVGTVLNYLPINVGEVFDDERAPFLIRELYSTGFFDGIELLRDGDNLVVKLNERPSISEVKVEGNEALKDEGLEQALEQIGMTRGKIFNELKLAKLELELQQLYFSLGKYAVKLDTDWRFLDDDRVEVEIKISEGVAALIHSINITGNQAFDEETLLKSFELETTDSGWFASDEYASTKLTGDLENLRSYYLDRGYVRFEIDSKQVTISPDRKDINITVNVTEGEQYIVNGIDISGEPVVDKDELMALVTFRAGDVFSRKKINRVVSLINKRLGEEGYAFSEVRTSPNINEDNKTVDLQFLVIPGRKMTVRAINFTGNDRTKDLVLRREMRQLEGEVYKESKLERSRVRLQRLNYLSSVNVRTVRVKDDENLLDIEVTVEERFSGSFQVGLGFSQTQGLILNLGLTHDNIFGTGNTVGLTFDNSASTQKYSFQYLNPYYTADGISRGFNLSYRKTDSAEDNFANFLLDQIRFSVSYGIPLSEYNSFTFDLGAVRNDIRISSSASTEVVDFIVNSSDEFDQNTDRTTIDGDDYDSWFSAVSVASDTRNRRIFADSGHLNAITLELFNGDLDYYKISYRHQTAIPVTDDITFGFRSRIGLGDHYSNTFDVPFFDKFTAGGVRSVRGYERNSLGPRDSKNDPFGGNFQVINTAELLIPFESLGSSDTFRVALYFDAGSVFKDTSTYQSSELRQSVGISAKWFSVVGPIEFSYAFPLNDQPGDDIRNFQFALGASF